MCLLIGIVFHVSDVAHGPCYFMEMRREKFPKLQEFFVLEEMVIRSDKISESEIECCSKSRLVKFHSL